MSEKHEHGNIKSLPESRLLIAFALTFSFMLVEFIGGYLTGSLALISDAMHMMTDAFALLLALIAIRAGKKQLIISKHTVMSVLKFLPR